MQLDKLLHLLAGFAIYTVFMAFFALHSVAYIAVIVAAVGKELYDKYNGGVPDIVDVYYTLGGGVLGILLWSFV